MILLHRHRFSVASYHRRVNPEQAEERLAQGLVIPVELTFEFWLDARSLAAEAFLDPGADSTTISLRWIREQAELAGGSESRPMANPNGEVREAIGLSIGGQSLRLGDANRSTWIGTQDEVVDSLEEMAGCEDLLLGRDFITQHGLLLLIDGDESSISLLLPADADNNHRRDSIRSAFDPEQQN